MTKSKQLGMNPSTASGRLVKDILWKFIVDTGNDICFQCGKRMTRETFSIEHKTPWMYSDDPVSLYFDLNNIAFSHKKCNGIAARRNTDAWKRGHKVRTEKITIKTKPGELWCWKCQRMRGKNKFSKNKSRHTGYQDMCNDCRKEVRG